MSQPEYDGRGTVDLPCCFYEEIPAMAHSIDTTGRLVRVSNRWLETLGYERSEVIGRKSVEFLTEESRRHAEESALPEFFRTGQCRDVPYQFVTKGGEVIDVLLSATCERDSEHRIVSSCAILVDMTERNLAAERLRKEMLRGEILLELYEKSPRLNDGELYGFALEQSVRLTCSAIGFLHIVSDDQKTIRLTVWSSDTYRNCSLPEASHYPIEEAGNWVDCVRLKRPVVYNDYGSSPNRKGLPEGHVPLNRYMSIPVLEDDKVRMVFGVGNKAGEYDDHDLVHIQLVAHELQKILMQRRSEGVLRRAHAELEKRVRERTTELAETVKALRESEERYRLLFENMLEGVAYCRMLYDEKGCARDFIYLEVNGSFARLTGLDDAAGKKVSELIPGIADEHPELFEIYGRVASTGHPEKFDIQVESLGGCFSVTVYGTGRDHFVVIFEDVTERKRLEKQTRHMASFPQLNPNPVLEADLSGRVTFCNPAVRSALAGLGMEESDAALFLPGDMESILKKWDGKSRLIVNREVLLGTRPFAEVVHVVPRFDVVRIYAHDISERKAAEEELLRHRDHLDQLVRERTEELDRRNAQLSFEIAERKRAEEELRRYARRIMEVEESMRRKLAAELHDEIGRDLTALGINCTIISDSLPEEARDNIGARIEDSRRLIEEVTRAVRNIMVRLRPPMLDDYGLPAALRWYADLVSKRTGIAVTVTTDKEFPGVSEVKEMILFRIAQEALTNIVKHSGARNAVVTFSVRDGVVRLAVSDDGKGLDAGQGSPLQPTSGWGLRLMRERVELFGGSFRIDSGPEKGTRLEVEIREDS